MKNGPEGPLCLSFERAGLQAQHDLQVLHGRAAGTLAQIVQAGNQHGLAVLLIGKHAQLQHSTASRPIQVARCRAGSERVT